MAASGRSAEEGIGLLTSGDALRLWKLDAADTAHLGSLVTSASSALEMMEKRALSPLDGANRILACLGAFGASLARASAAVATSAAAGHPVHGAADGGHFLAPVVVTPAPVAPRFPPGIPLPTSTPLRECGHQSHGPPEQRPINPQTRCGVVPARREAGLDG